MATSVSLFPCNSNAVHVSSKNDQPYPKSFLGSGIQILENHRRGKSKLGHKFGVYSLTKGSAEPGKPEETVPSWAKPDSDEPPPWAREGATTDALEGGGPEVPYIVYLLSSAVAAIAAIGSIFEYANQRPAFGVVFPDSVFYAPLLGFFTFTGFPVCAFLWFKAVNVANKEAEDQDRRDGYL